MTIFYVDNALQGAGDHSTPGNAGQFSAVWAKVGPADEVEVADGTNGDGKYQGDANMMHPTLINGSDGSPIIVRALNDGAPWIDGEEARVPGEIRGCTWMNFAGIDFGKGRTGGSAQSTLKIARDATTRSTDLRITRCCA